MRQMCTACTAAVILATTGCSPIIVTQHKEPGVFLAGQCITEGRDKFVQVYVTSAEGNIQWNVEFIGAAPEGLTIIPSPIVTSVRWKFDQNRIKAFRGTPYELKLTSGDKVIQANVVLMGTSEQIVQVFINTFGHVGGRF